ncbi:MAG: CHASE domain-containing protein [Magnetococcales bacterium]|nr:CHASE domain-containing protein [Magnetococcales bacterium]
MNQPPSSSPAHFAAQLTRRWFHGLRTYGMILLVMTAGMLFSLAIFVSVRSQITHHLYQEFEWVAQDRHRAVRKGLESALGAVHELNDLFISTPDIQAQTFQRVATLIHARYPEIEALQWVKLLPAPENQPPKNQPNEQALVTFQEPATGNPIQTEPDHYAIPGRRKLLEEARDTGKLVISGRIPLTPDDPQRLGFLAALPVYQPEAPLTTILERHRALTGYVIGIFQFANLAREAISMLEPRGVECMILDDQAPEEERYLHFYASRLANPPFTFAHPLDWQLWLGQPDPKLTAHTRLGNRVWSITCSQTNHFRSAEWFTHGHWVTLLTGLLLTGLLTHYLLRIKTDLLIRTRMAQQLAESERLLSVLFYRSPDIIRLVDRAGETLLVNRHPVPGEYDPTNPVHPAPTDFRQEYLRTLEQTFTLQEIHHLHLRARDDLWWEVRIVPLREETGSAMAMVVATDISENKMLEEQAAKNGRLASLGLMAAGVAHEINNPNNSIYYNANLLADAWSSVKPILDEYHRENGDFAISGLPYSEMGDKIPTIITWIIDNTDRIKKIVELLKNLARNDSGLAKEPVDLGALAHGTLLLLNNTIQKHTDQFSMRIPADLPLVPGHPRQLEQVLINVLVNALQSLPDRSRSVHLEATTAPSGREVILIVQDQGRGIPSSYLEKITEPFFTTRLEKGGTGLGLSISATIIKNHGGRLRFESVVNSGTTVFIHLPCARDA